LNYCALLVFGSRFPACPVQPVGFIDLSYGVKCDAFLSFFVYIPPFVGISSTIVFRCTSLRKSSLTYFYLLSFLLSLNSNPFLPFSFTDSAPPSHTTAGRQVLLPWASLWEDAGRSLPVSQSLYQSEILNQNLKSVTHGMQGRRD